MAPSKNEGNTDSISSEITFLLAPILSTYKKNIDILVQPFGICSGQPPLLSLLLERDGVSQKDLAGQLNVKPASVTTMVSRMEKAGLVRRRKDEDDLRVTRVYLTQKGRKTGKKMLAIVRFLNERNLAGFRNEEKLLLLRLLEQMKANLDTGFKELELIKNEKFEE